MSPLSYYLETLSWPRDPESKTHPSYSLPLGTFGTIADIMLVMQAPAHTCRAARSRGRARRRRRRLA